MATEKASSQQTTTSYSAGGFYLAGFSDGIFRTIDFIVIPAKAGIYRIDYS